MGKTKSYIDTRVAVVVVYFLVPYVLNGRILSHNTFIENEGRQRDLFHREIDHLIWERRT